MSDLGFASITRHEASSIRISDPIAGWSGVRFTWDGEVIASAGDESGRVMEMDNPWATPQAAADLLAQIKDDTYLPFEASDVIVDPAAEVGDAVTIGTDASAIFSASLTFDTLFSAEISAPADSELDHEFPFSDPKELDKSQVRDLVEDYLADDEALTDTVQDLVEEYLAGDEGINDAIEGILEEFFGEIDEGETFGDIFEDKLDDFVGEFFGELEDGTTFDDLIDDKLTDGTADLVVDSLFTAGENHIEIYNDTLSLVQGASPEPGAPASDAVTKFALTLDGGGATAGVISTWGAGNASGTNYGRIVKDTEGFRITFQPNDDAETGAPRSEIGIHMTLDGYLDLYGQRRVTALDFSGWTGEETGSYTETVQGEAAPRSNTVTFDEEGRPVKITDSDGFEMTIAW